MDKEIKILDINYTKANGVLGTSRLEVLMSDGVCFNTTLEPGMTVFQTVRTLVAFSEGMIRHQNKNNEESFSTNDRVIALIDIPNMRVRKGDIGVVDFIECINSKPHLNIRTFRGETIINSDSRHWKKG